MKIPLQSFSTRRYISSVKGKAGGGRRREEEGKEGGLHTDKKNLFRRLFGLIFNPIPMLMQYHKVNSINTTLISVDFDKKVVAHFNLGADDNDINIKKK